MEDKESSIISLITVSHHSYSASPVFNVLVALWSPPSDKFHMKFRSLADDAVERDKASTVTLYGVGVQLRPIISMCLLMA